ncbi:DUF4238 domain-containing protein [Enterobacter kobei]|uniref:DUF4238 domain-containing protein n=1 Tax=Enterobacter TaxID=547 RepID=UPI00062C63F0|nr:MULTISPECIES: DUF4238 domain-containing protein [Enterobacter]KKY78355.1 hypothetical protein OA44_17760 [Enterobacter cloacae]KZP65712.1 hypothetical protein A3462_05800 [Enterobacter bugandensis]MCK7113860.1 DUF4238 domain-containing protein [Enterobacter kobei]
MAYTKNQHVLSQWILRNFRSDDTAQSPREKQRVWCHTVFPGADGKNIIRDIPLPVSSVGVCKDCFRLTDGDTGELFDIEHELSDFERDMSVLVRDLVHNHNFARLAECDNHDFPVEKLAGFAVFQMLLNLNNPQNGFAQKEAVFQDVIAPVRARLPELISSTLSLPDSQPALAARSIYQKLIRIARSSSSVEMKAKAMFTVFSLLALQGLPTLMDPLDGLRESAFGGIYRIDIFHTGHAFDSTAPRPVFTVSANMFCHLTEERLVFLPLAHNLALRFHRYPETGFFSPPDINVFSPEPRHLARQDPARVRVYRCSFDYIDQAVSVVNMFNVGFSNIIYSCWQLSDVEHYLKLQSAQPEDWYLPEHPVCQDLTGAQKG